MNKSNRELVNIIFIVNVIYAISFVFLGLIKNTEVRIYVFGASYIVLPIINIILVLAIYMTRNTVIIKIEQEESKTKEVPSPSEFDLLDAIRAVILKEGERFPKKHGSWICLKLNENEFFSMDSWNGAIHFHEGEPQYKYWTGFSGSSSVYLGLSDKSWRNNDTLPLQKPQYAEYYEKVNLFINNHIKKKEAAS